MAKNAVAKKMIRAVVMRVNKPAVVEEIGADLDSMQQIVRGYIQAIPAGGTDGKHAIHIICNEDAKLLNMPINRRKTWEGEVLRGDFFLVASAPPDFVSLSEEAARRIAEIVG